VKKRLYNKSITAKLLRINYVMLILFRPHLSSTGLHFIK